MADFIILAATPGSGKTTVLHEAKKIDRALSIVNYGDMMLKEASLHHIDRDSMRKLPLSQQQELGLEAARKIAEQKDKVTIVDTHALVQTATKNLYKSVHCIGTLAKQCC